MCKKVRAAGMDELIAMGKELGVTLTAEDFKKPAEELSDDELDAVAGGSDVSCACAMGGTGYSKSVRKRCVCGHARMVMYISAEGRALPSMALSGMDIQEQFPLIPEIGLAECITDSRYMRLIDTRATEVLEHNPECRTCGHALQCLAGCRASALEFNPEDILAPDPAACEIFRGGWVEKIRSVMEKVNPEIKSRM